MAISNTNMSGYPNDGPPRPSNYSTNSADPFNQPQLAYDAQNPGNLPPGAGGPGQPYQYYDNDSDIGARYEGGGMARETWGSESGWSANGTQKKYPG